MRPDSRTGLRAFVRIIWTLWTIFSANWFARIDLWITGPSKLVILQCVLALDVKLLLRCAPRPPTLTYILLTNVLEIPDDQRLGNPSWGGWAVNFERKQKGGFVKGWFWRRCPRSVLLYCCSVFAPSFRFGGSVAPFLVSSFRFWGSREHPPKPPFWKQPFVEPPKFRKLLTTWSKQLRLHLHLWVWDACQPVCYLAQTCLWKGFRSAVSTSDLVHNSSVLGFVISLLLRGLSHDKQLNFAGKVYALLCVSELSDLVYSVVSPVFLSGCHTRLLNFREIRLKRDLHVQSSWLSCVPVSGHPPFVPFRLVRWESQRLPNGTFPRGRRVYTTTVALLLSRSVARPGGDKEKKLCCISFGTTREKGIHHRSGKKGKHPTTSDAKASAL